MWINIWRRIFKGHRNGKGKEYYYNGKLKFEGEYLNGKKNGEGKEYYDNGKLRFKGEYLNSYKLRGKEYVNEILFYEGEYLYNKKFDGIIKDENGIIELKNGNGKVKEYYSNGELEMEMESFIIITVKNILKVIIRMD